MCLLDLISKVIVEHGSAEILNKHLALVKEEALILTKQNDDLKKENADLKMKLSKMDEQVTANSIAKEFVEHKGALFKRKPDGGYFESAYCPRCKNAMASGFKSIPFQCLPCGHIAQFKNDQLLSVIRELPK